jgi:hypothetical protein
LSAGSAISTIAIQREKKTLHLKRPSWGRGKGESLYAHMNKGNKNK